MNQPDILQEVDLHQLKVTDAFLGQYQRLVRDVVIPYQWDALNDRISEADPSHAIENFEIAAGRKDGEFYGIEAFGERVNNHRAKNRGESHHREEQ